MKVTKVIAFLTAIISLVIPLTGCKTDYSDSIDTSIPQGDLSYEDALKQGAAISLFDDDENDGTEGALSFRPVDIGVQAQKEYIYPFIGLRIKPSDIMYEKIDNREVYVSLKDDYEDALTVNYALMRFFATTEEQRGEVVTSIDCYAWEESLKKLGAVGIYKKGIVKELDDLTGCDIHEKIGASDDGKYEYYLSIKSDCDKTLIDELKKVNVIISKMREFDPSYSYNAFSVGKDESVNSAGPFTTKDVFGKEYTESVFEDYDLTLVNVLTTWCTYCVEEMPTLEELRKNYTEQGVKFNVVAVVLDTKYGETTDTSAVELAQTLHKKSDASFPFLIPDENNMNGRLVGIENFPESFFVDKNGNIVSDAYLGARTLKEWSAIVETELNSLKEINK